MESDMLKMYDSITKLGRVNFWQILLMLLAFYLEGFQVAFGVQLSKS
jgi:hypothetical protein